MEPHYTADEIFEKKDFTQTPLKKGDYDNCTFNNCDFSNSNFSGFKFIDCVFTGCNLSLVMLGKTVFRDIQFNHCKMLGLHFDHCSDFGLSFSFDNCILNHSSFYQVKIKNTTFKTCQLQEVDFAEADLTGCIFAHCDFTNAAFDNTILEKADLRTSGNYAIDPAMNKVKKAKFSLSEIAGLLYKYDIDIDAKS